MIVTLHHKEVDEEMLNTIVNAYNTAKDIITIYLMSDGGYICVMKAIVDLINSDPDAFELVGYDILYSAAFEIFVTAKCKKRLLPNTVGMYHQSSRKLTINSAGKAQYKADEIVKEKAAIFHKEELKFIKKCGFTNKETKQFKKDHDVYFHTERFNEIAKHYSSNAQNWL